MPAVRRTIALELFWTVHRWVYQKTGGRLGSRMNGMPVLLLTTTGRRTGRRRTTPLQYLGDGEKYVVVASNAGEPQHPAWLLNLKSDPQATIQIGHTRTGVSAREVTGDERRRLWSRIIEADRSYSEYQKRTTRQITVVTLEPATVSPR